MNSPGSAEVRAAPVGFGGYSPDEMAATVRLSSREDPRWQLVLPVTRRTRDFVIDKMPSLLVTYALAIALLLATATIERTVPAATLGWWLLESALSILARTMIFGRMVRASPVDIASRPLLRLLPLGAILLAGAHWSWTATLFIGPRLDLTTVVVLLTYVMLSVACIGMMPASPVICAAYMVPMWAASAWMLAQSEWASGSILLVLSAALAGALWSGFYVVVSGVRRQLVQSDEAELLMQALSERNAEVESLRAAAAADLETRSTVFASASHDVRQRIHALKLLAHVSTDGTPATSPSRRLSSAIGELETFVTELLRFVRFDSVGAPQQLTVVPLQEVLQGLELQFEAQARQRGAVLRTRATPLCIRTDPVMLSRLLENLASNAIKFTRHGVLVTARQRAGDVHLEIWDQGPGLEPDRLLGNVGVPNSAASPNRTEGFGLGLLIVRRLVDALGYRIQVQSRPARGTRIGIVIPAQHVYTRESP